MSYKTFTDLYTWMLVMVTTLIGLVSSARESSFARMKIFKFELSARIAQNDCFCDTIDRNIFLLCTYVDYDNQ